MINAEQSTIYVNSAQKNAFYQFTSALEKQLNNDFHPPYHDIVIICIGSDRSTGDSLGPLVGQKLNTLKHNHITIYGSLREPVHAKNLEKTLGHIRKVHRAPFIIAVDACLGKMDHVGYVTISKGSLKPGACTNKNLPEVGDVSITGIVNFSGFMDFLVLQNTRLGLVMEMADLISLGLKYVLWKKQKRDKEASCQKGTAPVTRFR
ncbi:MAG: spore protease YyaC [Firmicutes bacterium]|nr:spore protease YyaC [Bacillota bacterium]